MSYDILLWRKSEEQDISFQEIARRAYDTMMVFNELPEELRPNYCTAKRKKDAKRMNWEYDSFCKHLECNVNREGKIIFRELGYTTGWFSNMRNDYMSGYGLSVGNTTDISCNTLVVSLPYIFNMDSPETYEKIESVFRKAVQVFEPFWAAVCDDDFGLKYSDPDNNKILGLHWLTYGEKGKFDNLREDRLENISSAFPEASYENGILKLKTKPIFGKNEEDVRYKNSVEDYLLIK